MAKAKISVKSNMSTKAANAVIKKIVAEKERIQAVKKAQKAKDDLMKLK